MALGMVSAVACGHGQPEQSQDQGEKEHVGERSQAVTSLAWPSPAVVSGGKVGTLPGGGGVDPTGAYSYTLPIEVPPGLAGMTPSLTLSYSSTSGNGLLGVGWNLSGGISAIAPCNKTIAVDGFVDARAGMCLDGARLVDIGNGEWRTESDRFARITGDESTNFKVELKDGRILHYTTAVTAALSILGPNFLLSYESDRDGNTINYQYARSGMGDAAAPWEMYLTEIGYGKDASFGGEGVATGSRRIVLGYDTTRPDPIYSDLTQGDRIVGEANSIFATTAIKRRLRSISCYAPGTAPVIPGAQVPLAWTYTLSYLPSSTSGRSILTSVKRTGALGGESYSKEFAWQQTKGGGTFTRVNAIGPFDDPNEAVMAIDVDNNGKDELLVGSTSSILASTPTLYSTGATGPILSTTKALAGLSGATFKDARVADMFGDGVPEILAPDRFADGQGTKAYRLYQWSGATQDYSQTNLPQSIWGNYVDSLSFGAEQPIFLADFDADGLPDLVQARHSYPIDSSCTLIGTPSRPKCLAYDWYYSHNTGSGGFSPTFVGQTTAILYSDVKKDKFHAPLTGSPFASLATANGAGRVNLIASAYFAPGDSGSLDMLALAAGDPAPTVRRVQLPTNALCRFGDFRGRGAYQQECFDPVSVNSLLLDPKDWRISTYDVDADGRTDLLAYNFGTDGSGHFRVTGLSYRIYYDVAGVRHQDPITQIPLVGGDFNGDGIEDAYFYDRSSDQTYVGLQDAPTRDLMYAVAEEGTTSLPSEIVTYSQRWSPDPVQAMECVHPQRCIRRGMNVVVEHDVFQGTDVNAYDHHIYSYDDPRADVHGRGFLGFATVREWNPDRPAETITTYDNASSLAGVYQSSFPTVVRSYVPVDSILGKREGKTSLQVRVSETASKYEDVWLHQAKTHFVHRASWTSTEWETPAQLDWTPNISNHFSTLPGWTILRVRNGSSLVDDNGNETHREDTTVGGVATVVDKDYEYRFPEWLINLVQNKRTTVRDPSSGVQTPQPRRVDYEYDALGHLAAIKVEKFSTVLPEVIQQRTELEYVNSHGLVTSIKTFASGEVPRSVHIEYDPEEGIFPRKTWNDLGHTAWTLYHPTYGVVSDSLDPNGLETKTVVDDFGRVYTTQRGTDAPVVITYTPRLNGTWLVGTYVNVRSDGQVPVTTTLDSLGRVVLEQHAGFDYDPVLQQNTYDVLGRLIFSSRPHSNSVAPDGTTYAYDPMDRLRSVTAPDKSTITQKPSFWTTVTDGPVPFGAAIQGYVAHESYVERDVDGRVIVSAQVSPQATLKTKFAYGDFNQLRTITDPNTNVTTITYDQRGRRIQLDDPDTGRSVTHYNGFGEVTSTDLPSLNGSSTPSTTTYLHDVLGRVTDVLSPDGASKFTWDTAPNGVGKLASRSGPDGTKEAFFYDTSGRLQQHAWNVHGPVVDEAFDILMAYDGSGRPSSVTYPAVPGRATRFKTELRYRADAVGSLNEKGGYLQKVTEVDLPIPLRLWNVDARNADDRLLAGTTGNNVTEHRIYDSVTGRLSSIGAISNVSPTPVLSLDYTYWPDGAVKSRGDVPRGRNETFDYGDGLSRLTAWHLAYGGVTQNVGYHFDPIGNLDQVTVGGSPTEENTPDPHLPHALATTKIFASGVVRGFKYDTRGRQYSATDSDRTVTFNEFNLPKTIKTDAGVTTFDYDAAGRRVKKTDATGVETITLGGLYERRKDNKKTVHVFYVPGSDGNLTQVSYSDDGTTKKEWREYIHPDALGSAVAVSDDNSAVTRFDSEPFGKRIQPNGSTFTGGLPNVQVGFTGHHMDDDLGLVNMKGRIYDPSQRRFISPDPLVARPMNVQSYNRYSYVYNNPLNLTDPSGFCGFEGEDECPVVIDGQGNKVDCQSDPFNVACSTDNPAQRGPYTEQPCNGNTSLPGCYGHGAPHAVKDAPEPKPVHQVAKAVAPPIPPPAEYHAVSVPASFVDRFDAYMDGISAAATAQNRADAEQRAIEESIHPHIPPQWWAFPDTAMTHLEKSCPQCAAAVEGLQVGSAIVMAAQDMQQLEAVARDVTALVSSSRPMVTLFHGHQEPLVGGEFNVDVATDLQREGTPDPGVYLTNNLIRAATQYAGPKGYVTMTRVSPGMANSMVQESPIRGPRGVIQFEWVARTPEQVKALNEQRETLSQMQALRAWLGL